MQCCNTQGNKLLAAVLVASEARLPEFTLEELRQLGQVCVERALIHHKRTPLHRKRAYLFGK